MKRQWLQHLLHHSQWFMGAQQGAASASLWWWHRWFMAFRNRLFSLRLLVSRPEYRAVSLFRARQADSGQNEGKEFSRGGFFGTTRNKGAWFGFEKERDERGVCCPRMIFPQSLEFRGGRGSIKCLGKKETEVSGNCHRSGLAGFQVFSSKYACLKLLHDD